MDLGSVKLPRTGVNSLRQALHPERGVAWTDGERVCVTPLRPGAWAGPEFGDTSVVGQFEEVLGVSWSSQSPALLAVQHRKCVSVWRPGPGSPETWTRTCEASEELPLLAQGCVWHPRSDALALVTERGVSVLWDAAGSGGRRARAEVRGGGQVRCACWTGDGGRLVVAVGTALRSYAWDDARGTLTACGLCPAFDVGGRVCALEPAGDTLVAAATELPLDTICGLNAGLAFDDPLPSDLSTSDPSSLKPGDDGCPLDDPPSPSSGPLDLTHIPTRPRRSDPSPLIHLRRRDTLTGSGRDSSHLLLVSYERKVTATVAKVGVPGVLVPDLIALGPGGRLVAVASNTCGVVLVYSVTGAATPIVQRIQLPENERPKGVRFLSGRALLLMVGRQKSRDPAFLPSSNTNEFLTRLMTEELVLKEEEGGGSVPTRDGRGFGGWGGKRNSENVSAVERFGGIGELVLPGGAFISSPGGRGRRLVEEVQSSPLVSSTDHSDRATSGPSSITAETSAASLRFEASDRTSSGLTPPPPRRENLPGERPSQDVGGGVFTRLQQRCPSEIRDERKTSGRYPPSSDPPYAIVTCQQQLSGGVFVKEMRPVLLCEDKLCLRVLQELFNLPVLEMMCGQLWVVLVADAEGFVPLTFRPKEEVTVRSGKRNSPVSSGNGDGQQSESPP